MSEIENSDNAVMQCSTPSDVQNVQDDEKSKFVHEQHTLFNKIIDRSIPADIIYEDDQRTILYSAVFGELQASITDINNVLVHGLDIYGISRAADEDQMLLGHLLLVARKLAKEKNLLKGYRLVINDREESNPSVFHLHVHVMGGRPMQWPPG